jgi:glucosamine--fructose-6-phosphate aminotransferase (isomerizing)
MATDRQWLGFADGCAAQPESLRVAAQRVGEWLAGGHARGLEGQRLLLGGIGASFASLATPLYVLREKGVVAYRTSCGELPPSGAELGDYFIGVSQSGRSRETLQTLLDAPAGRRLAVVNASSSPLGDAADTLLTLGDLPDSRMSSVGFTATVVALGMLVDRLVTGAPGEGWDRVGDVAAEAVEQADATLEKFAQAVASSSVVDVVGDASSLTAAEQSALLLREGPFVPSMAMDTRSYLHGPMDCAGPTSHVLFGREREGLLAEQLSERDVPILLVTDTDIAAPASIVRIPQLPPCQRAVVQVALVQRLVLHVGAVLGRDVDASVFRRLDTKVEDAGELGAR